MGLTLNTILTWAVLFDLGAVCAAFLLACAAFLLACAALSSAGVPLEAIPRRHRIAAVWCLLAEATGGTGYLARLREAVEAGPRG